MYPDLASGAVSAIELVCTCAIIRCQCAADNAVWVPPLHAGHRQVHLEQGANIQLIQRLHAPGPHRRHMHAGSTNNRWHASAGCRVSVDCTSPRRATRSAAGEQQHAKATASTMTLLLPAPFLCMYQHHTSVVVLISMTQRCNQ